MMEFSTRTLSVFAISLLIACVSEAWLGSSDSDNSESSDGGWFDNVVDSTKDTWNDAKEKAGDVWDDAKEKAKDTWEDVKDKAEYAKDFAGGTVDMADAYLDMREANYKNSDKYFHARGNNDAANRGPGGKKAAEIISDLREWTDKTFKGDSSDEIAADQEANEWGRKGGDPNKYRPEGLPDKYKKK